MESIKTIEAILAPTGTHMVGDGFRVNNFFPASPLIGERGMSPFFLLDYNPRWVIPPSEKVRGVGAHPHRGFETVTIAYHGSLAHHDSAGNSGVIREGDVQWMTAGSGVLHKEYHEKEFSRRGGIFQVVQLWVNLPKEAKMTPPRYQTIEKKDLPTFVPDDKKSLIEIIAGEYKGIKGRASTFTPVALFNARLQKGATADFNFSETYNTGILIVEGEVKINDLETAPNDHFVYFKHDGTGFTVRAIKDSVALIMSGEPIGDPIASYGPFLMNTEDEIKEAFEDFRTGKFGQLED